MKRDYKLGSSYDVVRDNHLLEFHCSSTSLWENAVKVSHVKERYGWLHTMSRYYQ